MIAVILFSLGLKGVSIVAAVSLIAGGYLSYRYSSYVAKKAASAVSEAKSAVGSVEKKL